ITVDAAGGGVELNAAGGHNVKVLRAGANVKGARLHGFVDFRFFHANAGEFGELRRELRSEGCRHVLHQKNRGREVTREAWRKAHHGGGPAGGGAHDHDREALVRGNDGGGANGRRWLGGRRA